MVEESATARLAPLRDQLSAHLSLLYGPETGAATLARLEKRITDFIDAHGARDVEAAHRLANLTAADAMVITYGDQVQESDRAPLATLHEWMKTHLGDTVSSVHILPFYPYSSDDGFSVIDYTAVDPKLGNWSDIERMSQDFKLMFDAVVNHISAHSAWFQGFLQGDPRYQEYFIVVDEPADLSMVTRPRTHPLLTTFETATGPHKVWTTFSTDQIDLNFANPDVLLEIIDVLLLYVAKGAIYLRLDAIGYLWKTIGTRSIHLPETHTAVQLMRTVLDVVAPDVILITETNVPHKDNISYFGDGHNEAQLVYQFPLAPLVLHSFRSGSTRYLQNWARGLETPSADTTFFNFLASHDGIGVQPASDILSREEMQALVDMTEQHGGRVSYKTNSDGTQSAYELNITLMDALSDPAMDESVAIDRFMTANAIMLALAGLPGIYIHSLVGSRNDIEGMQRTGHNRTINRRKWQQAEIDQALATHESREARVMSRFKHMLQQRARSAAFNPTSPQVVLDSPDGIFTILRRTPDGSEHVVCIHNVTGQSHRFELQLEAFMSQVPATLFDLLSNEQFKVESDGVIMIEVPPHQALWLRTTR